VQATLSDLRDVTLLPLHDLEALMQRPTTDVRLILAYCRQSLIAPIGASEAKCLWALRQYGSLLMEQADAHVLAGLVVPLSLPTARQIPPMLFLRLGSRLERAGTMTAQCGCITGCARSSRPARTSRWPTCAWPG